MKKFITDLALFSIMFFVFDKLFLPVRNQAAAREVDKRLEYVIKGEVNKDIVVIGSSRGARDILAERIEDSTGYTTYNLSYPGSDISFHSFLLESLLAFNRHPKLVLLSIDDPAQLLEFHTIKFRLDRLYPLVRYPYIRDELIQRGEKNKILSEIFILHQLNEANFLFVNKKFTTLDSLTDHGSMPISFQDDDRPWNYVDADTAYHVKNELPEKLLAFNKFLALCKQHNIELVLVVPPNYRTLNTSFLQRIQELAGEEVDVMFYDDQRPEYRDRRYYYDESHLMTTGAEIFTDQLIDYLEKRWTQDSLFVK